MSDWQPPSTDYVSNADEAGMARQLLDTPADTAAYKGLPQHEDDSVALAALTQAIKDNKDSKKASILQKEMDTRFPKDSSKEWTPPSSDYVDASSSWEPPKSDYVDSTTSAEWQPPSSDTGESPSTLPSLFSQTKDTLGDLAKAAVDKPASIIPGAAEALVGGVGAMGEAAASGVYGLGKGLFGQQPFGQGFQSGVEQAQQFMEPATKLMQPETDFGKAALNTLGLLPAAAHSAGETTFEAMNDSSSPIFHAMAPAMGAGVEAGVNLAMMLGLPTSKASKMKAANKNVTELIKQHTDAISEALPTLQSTIDDSLNTRVQSGKTLEETIRDPSSKAFDVLDAIASHDKTRPDQKELAKALIRLNEVQGHGDLPVYDLPRPGSDKPAGSYIESAGEQPWGKDNTMNFDSEAITHRNLDINNPEQSSQILLHEIVHSVSAKNINWFEEMNMKPGFSKDSLSPEQRIIYDKIDDINTLFKDVSDRYYKQEGVYGHEQFNTIPDRNQAFNFYGFKNLRDFVSESLTSKGFQEKLRSIKIPRNEETQFKFTRDKGVIGNAWEAFKGAFKKLIGMGESHPILDAAVERSIDLIESGPKRQHAQRDYQIQEAKKSLDNNTYSKFMFKRTADILDASGSDKNMFETRMRAEQGSKDWQDFVTKNLDTLWENARRIKEVAGENTDYSKLPESDKLLQHNPLTIDEFFDQTIPKDRKLVQADDLNTAGTDVMSGQITNLLKGKSLAGKVMKFVKNKMEEYRTLQAVLFHSSMEQFGEFNKLPRPEKLKVMDMAIDFNQIESRTTLEKMGLQWPTEDMIRSRYPDMNDKQVKAYLDITKGLNFLHNLLNQARKVNNLEPLKQIPGYMPHVFEGAYKVFVTTKGPNGSEFVSHIQGFKTKYGAYAFAERVKAGLEDKQGMKFGIDMDPDTKEPFRVAKFGDPSSGLVSTLQEHLKAYQNQLQLAPEIREALQEIEKKNIEGFSKHMLERSDVKNYIGEMGTKTDGYEGLKEQLGIGSSYNNKILSLYENYAKSVTDYYKNVLWVNEVHSRILGVGRNGDKPNYGDLFNNLRKLNTHLDEFSRNFTGENINKMAWVDDFFRSASLKLGVDPNLYRSFGRDARNLLSMVKLRANPGNYLANILQPIQMLSLMQFVNGSRAVDGLKSPNVAVSFAKVMKSRLFLDEYQKAGLQWAREQHILEPTLEPELRQMNLSGWKKAVNTVTLGDINPKIEEIGRNTSYLLALEHFRTIYPEDPMAARRAAANLMEMGMVNYDRSSRPLMYQNMGFVGEQLSPFAVFRNAYVGNTYLTLKLAYQAPGKMSSFAPIIAMQLGYLATAGALGMVGAVEFDLLVNTINKIFPEWNFPTLEELLFKHHVPDYITFGAVSNATKAVPGLEEGTNIGGSMTAVGADDVFALPMFPFLQAIAITIGVSARDLASKLTDRVNPVGSSDIYKAGKQLIPGIFQGYWEDQFKDNPDVALKGSAVEGYVERTQAGRNSINWTGRQSIDETKRRLIERERTSDEKAITDQLKTLTQLAADQVTMSHYTGIDMDEIKRRATSLGVTYDEFMKGVVDEIINRRTTVKSREAQQSTVKAYRGYNARREME